MNHSVEWLREEVYRIDGARYPARSLAKQYLAPGFEWEKGYFLDDLMLVQKASFIMLCRQNILPVQQRSSIRRALQSIKAQDIRAMSYDPGYAEDMYFAVETKLAQLAGNCATNLHLGRSRNDLIRTVSKMGLRRAILGVINPLNHLAQVLLAFAKRHRDTLSIEYTHTQQAQPATIGHYMAGFIHSIRRNVRRMEAALAVQQECPLGAGALTTSGFPIDRELLCRLLGFDSVQENSYEAIASSDFLCEPAAALAVLAVDLGRFMQHLHVWSALEYGFLRMGDAYTGISSMMPQKRNPCTLERMRASASEILGQCHAVLLIQHNTEWEGNLEAATSPAVLHESLNRAKALLDLLGNMISTLTLDEQLLRKRAMGSHSVMTELADALVRQEGIDYRSAHHVVSALVDRCAREELALPDISSEHIAEAFRQMINRPLTQGTEALIKSLDAQHCVDIRTVLGGPASQALDECFDGLSAWLEESRRRYLNAIARINQCSEVLNDGLNVVE